MTSRATPTNTNSSFGLDAATDRAALRARADELDRWRQGDLLTGVPLSWVAPAGFDEFTGLEAAWAHEDRCPVAMWDESSDENEGGDRVTSETGWAIITSQTCDIAGVGPGARHHTVQVAPVVLGTGRMSDDRLAAARRGDIVELVRVPEVPEAGEWFADLRLSVPVSKAVLLTQQPRRGFSREEQALDFAETVASKARRPSVHGAISSVLVPALSKFVADAIKRSETWPDSVEQIRLEVMGGERLYPSRIRLVVIGYRKLGAVERNPLRDFHRGIRKKFKKDTTDPADLPAGIEMMFPRFASLDDIRVTDYRNTIPLAIDGFDGYW